MKLVQCILGPRRGKSSLARKPKAIPNVFNGKKIFNQRTSGPVNPHLTPGPGIYFNALIHVYIAPGLGQITPWGQILMSTESPCHFAHLLQVLKQSLKYDVKNILNDFIHVYSPRAGTDNPLGTKF